VVTCPNSSTCDSHDNGRTTITETLTGTLRTMPRAVAA